MEDYCTYQYLYKYESEEEKDELLDILDCLLDKAHSTLVAASNDRITIHCPD